MRECIATDELGGRAKARCLAFAGSRAGDAIWCKLNWKACPAPCIVVSAERLWLLRAFIASTKSSLSVIPSRANHNRPGADGNVPLGRTWVVGLWLDWPWANRKSAKLDRTKLVETRFSLRSCWLSVCLQPMSSSVGPGCTHVTCDFFAFVMS